MIPNVQNPVQKNYPKPYSSRIPFEFEVVDDQDQTWVYQFLTRVTQIRGFTSPVVNVYLDNVLSMVQLEQSGKKLPGVALASNQPPAIVKHTGRRKTYDSMGPELFWPHMVKKSTV